MTEPGFEPKPPGPSSDPLSTPPHWLSKAHIPVHFFAGTNVSNTIRQVAILPSRSPVAFFPHWLRVHLPEFQAAELERHSLAHLAGVILHVLCPELKREKQRGGRRGEDKGEGRRRAKEAGDLNHRITESWERGL